MSMASGICRNAGGGPRGSMHGIHKRGNRTAQHLTLFPEPMAYIMYWNLALCRDLECSEGQCTSITRHEHVQSCC